MNIDSDHFEDTDNEYLDALDLWNPPARAKVARKPKTTRSGIIKQLTEIESISRTTPQSLNNDHAGRMGHENALTDENRAKNSFNPTFGGLSTAKNHVSNHEREWIFTYLGSFYEEQLITDVIRRVKSGKEATVYCCAADPRMGVDLLAGKVYHERMFRSLKNDSLYREGRAQVDDEGNQVRGNRVTRALEKNTAFGQKVRHGSWLNNEFAVMQRLHAAGADVPKPFAQSENAVLMEFVGGREGPAPALINVRLEKSEARQLFERLLWNIDLMFANNLVHGDLSAHNILYWEGVAKIIDFPQAVVPFVNPHAYNLLVRDIKRICEYFARYGISANPEVLTKDLWDKYVPS